MVTLIEIPRSLRTAGWRAPYCTSDRYPPPCQGADHLGSVVEPPVRRIGEVPVLDLPGVNGDLIERLGRLHGAAIAEGAFSSGPAVWVGKREVAHIDDDQALDVRLTKEVIRRRRSSLRADRRIVLRPNSSDWLEVRIESEADMEFALSLVEDAIAANLDERGARTSTLGCRTSAKTTFPLTHEQAGWAGVPDIQMVRRSDGPEGRRASDRTDGASVDWDHCSRHVRRGGREHEGGNSAELFWFPVSA